MTDEDLQTILARAQAATPGPWHYGGESLDYYVGGHHVDVDLMPPHTDRKWLAATIDGREDAEFIAAARTDVPALLAEVNRLKAALKRAVDALGWDFERGAPRT